MRTFRRSMTLRNKYSTYVGKSEFKFEFAIVRYFDPRSSYDNDDYVDVDVDVDEEEENQEEVDMEAYTWCVWIGGLY